MAWHAGQRAGNRRYYRPAGVELARTIHRLLNSEGYTVRGVQKVLRSKDGSGEFAQAVHVAKSAQPAVVVPAPTLDVSRLKALRDRLASLID